jgi:2-dehydropantoate 2-reductase
VSAAAGAPSAPRRVAVVGAGAVGTLLGGLLAAAGAEVTLVDARVPVDAPLDVIIHEPGGREVAARVRRAGRLADVQGAPDLVVLAVKMFDITGALDDLAAWPAATVLTIQNGIGAEELVASARPGAGLVAGSLTSPVERPGPAEVRWRGRGGIALAVVAGDAGADADWLAAAFATAGLPARRLDDPRAMKWSKLLGNLVGNALSALADREPAAIYADPVLFDLERRQLVETLAVMRAARIPVVALPAADVRLLALAIRLPAPLSRAVLRRVVGGARGGKSPSLRLHLQSAEGPTEAAWLNGAVARAGAVAGVPTPVNAALARLLDAVVGDPELRDELAARPHRIAELAARPHRIAELVATDPAPPASNRGP